MIKSASRHYFLWTIGCQMNAADSRRLASELEALGYKATDNERLADVIVLNTCVVRQQAEDKIVGRLGSLKTVKEANPNAVIGLMGCMVGRHEAPALKARFPHVDVFMAPSETEPMVSYLKENGLYELIDESVDEDRAFRDALQDAAYLLPAEQRGSSVTAFVPVVLGCSHACSFCIIPYRRGVERSRPQVEVLDEIRAFADQGVKEVMLLGQIVDRYGKDLDNGESLAGLLQATHAINGIDRIRFLTSHPNWMTDDLLQTVADFPKICPQLEVPIQAGNNDVLATMRRGYTREDYLRLIDRIRHFTPEAAIHTDIIVGFCGETEAQFMDTYRLFEEVRFDKTHIAKYSVRPRTVAARRMEDDVPAEEKTRRWKMLDDLQQSILAEKNAALMGQQVSVLVESRRKERWHGRTPHNKLVFFDDDRQDLAGQTVDVTVDWTGPYSLVGHGQVAEACTLT